MISSISGKIEHIAPDSVVLETNGIGYRVFMLASALTALRLNEPLKLQTYLHVREDEMSLYGFMSARELAFFKLLLQAPGVGPKTALGVMAIATVDSLIRAIGSGDATLLTKVAGIGKKTSERIVVELKSRLEKEHPDLMGQGGGVHADVISALVSLGYTPFQARDAVKQLPEDLKSAEEGIRMVLKGLGKKNAN